MKAINKKSPEDIYLEYINEWLTIKAMSEYYNTTMTWMVKKIEEGNIEHKRNTQTQ